MAHLKLTLSDPPAATEVKAQVDRAIRRAATGTNFPLEFSLENDQKQAVIYLGNVPKSMRFQVKNTGRRTIFFDHGGRAASHFELRFRPGVLTKPEDIGIQVDTKYPGWSLAYHREPDGTDVLGFAHTPGASQADSALAPGEALPLTLTNVLADERGGSRSTRVQLRYSLQYDNFNPVEGSRLHFLSVLQMPESEIQNNLNALIDQKIPDLAGAQEATKTQVGELWKAVKSLAEIESKLLQITAVPLAVWAEGSPFIINNGQTLNILRLQIGHIGGPQDALKLHNANGVRTSFRFEFNQTKEWGLFAESDHNTLRAEINADDGGWDVKDWELIQTANEIKLLYKGVEAADFSAGRFICLQLTFTCSRAPGQAHLVINYENIGQGEKDQAGKVSYPHGHLSLNLIRSPFAPERSGDGTFKTVVSGKLDLVETAQALPTIEMRRGVWQVGEANAPDASVGVEADGSLTIHSKDKITLEGHVFAKDVTITGKFDADGHTINALEVIATNGVTASEYKLSGVSAQSHDYGYVVPKGGIIMWHGSVDDIPKGWALCNGSNGTPDLSGKFIIGAGVRYRVDSTGGEERVTLSTSEMPAHRHSVSLKEAGDHAHTYKVDTGAHGDFGTGLMGTGKWDNLANGMAPTTSAGSHSHDATISSTGNSSSHNNLPPYYALCFIMKL